MFGGIKEMRAYNLELRFQLECLFVSCFCLSLFIILSILSNNCELENEIYICMMLGRFLNLQAYVGGFFDFDA